jgi:hypothetical protein
MRSEGAWKLDGSRPDRCRWRCDPGATLTYTRHVRSVAVSWWAAAPGGSPSCTYGRCRRTLESKLGSKGDVWGFVATKRALPVTIAVVVTLGLLGTQSTNTLNSVVTAM